MDAADNTGEAAQTQDKRLREADAKTHMVVTHDGDTRYLYKDATGWYVWRFHGRERIAVDADGFLVGVTLP